MTRKRPPVNIAASVAERLRQKSRESNVPYEFLLLRYANERFLYRLQHSQHADQFILKGAQLFLVWEGLIYRPTRDVDLLGFGEASHARVENVFGDICRVEADPDDGLRFDPSSIQITDTRPEDEYDGFRVKLNGNLDQSRIRMQFDIGFGDAVTPAASAADYPTILDHPAPRIRVYPVETVIAEKLEAMIRFGIANSRMKDFRDLQRIARHQQVRGQDLVTAIRATFQRRNASLPVGVPLALTEEFYGNRMVQSRWRGFLAKQDPPTEELASAIAEIRRFLLEPLTAVRQNEPFQRDWMPGGPWE